MNALELPSLKSQAPSFTQIEDEDDDEGNEEEQVQCYIPAGWILLNLKVWELMLLERLTKRCSQTPDDAHHESDSRPPEEKRS